MKVKIEAISNLDELGDKLKVLLCDHIKNNLVVEQCKLECPTEEGLWSQYSFHFMSFPEHLELYLTLNSNFEYLFLYKHIESILDFVEYIFEGEGGNILIVFPVIYIFRKIAGDVFIAIDFNWLIEYN